MKPKHISCFIAVIVATCLGASSKPIINGENAEPQKGMEIYKARCLACHQADGSGVPGMYPPLEKSDWVNGNKTKLINVLLLGVEGEIEVNGEIYSQIMPKQDYLTDQQIADVLSYIRCNFKNASDPIQQHEVFKVRNEKK